MPSLAWAGLGYLLTCLLGVWAAYDPALAWWRFGQIACGLALAVPVAFIAVRGGPHGLVGLGLGYALLAASIGIAYGLAIQVGPEAPARFGPLRQVELWVVAHRPLSLPFSIHDNAAAAALAVTIPLALPALVGPLVRRAGLLRALTALALIAALAALGLSGSRGAWIGLLLGLLVAAAWLGWGQQLSQAPWRRLVVGLVTLSCGLLLLATLSPGGSIFEAAARLPRLLFGESAPSRLDLWRRLLPLARDYLFTGSGYGSLSMAYSSYVLLIHVPYFQHAHNLYLQVLLEQGLPGLLAFGALAWFSFRAVARPAPEPSARVTQAAALAALTALLVHGLLDSELYASPFVPLALLPFGYALGVASFARPAAPVVGNRTRWRARVGWSALALGAIGVGLLPTVRAASLANLGAVHQTRQELATYSWPRWRIQDAVRRSPAVDLDPAIAAYQAALALDPSNPTANRRLGQIMLARGDEATAQRLFQAAYRAAPYERATRQLLGETHAINGNVTGAVALWRTVDLGQDQLQPRVFWYRDIGQPDRAALIARAAALIDR